MKTLSIAMLLAVGLMTAPAAPAAVPDGTHDFDWEFGTWKTHVRRLLHPLTGSTAWGEYDGTSVVRQVWSGKANMVELEVEGRRGISSWRPGDSTIRTHTSGA